MKWTDDELWNHREGLNKKLDLKLAQDEILEELGVRIVEYGDQAPVPLYTTEVGLVKVHAHLEPIFPEGLPVITKE